jgi:hypothetical protein
MVHGFEHITHELNEHEEKVLLPVIANRIATSAVGKVNAITGEQLIGYLQSRSMKSSPARIRKIVQYIREAKILRGLLASGNGYYISTNSIEIKEYADKSYGSRIREMLRVHQSLLDDAEYLAQRLQGELFG